MTTTTERDVAEEELIAAMMGPAHERGQEQRVLHHAVASFAAAAAHERGHQQRMLDDRPVFLLAALTARTRARGSVLRIRAG